MSPGQRNRFFMPPWQRCCRLNGWHTQDGAAAPARGEWQVTSDEMRKVITFARQLSVTKRGTPAFTLREMHHACYIVALGRDKETEHLTNDDQDRIVALVNYLADPLDLKACQVWQAYQRGENPGNKKRRQWFIKSRAPEAVSRHIALDLTQGRTKDLESLSDQEEANLARLLAQRPVYPGAKAKGENRKSGNRTYVLNPHKKFSQGNKCQGNGENSSDNHSSDKLVYVKGPF